jgi:hypothetical protein
MGKGGEVFVLDMGEQIKVVDLARDLIRLSGLEEGTDIRIEFTGLTPGEKMDEQLFYPEEKVERTANEKIIACWNGYGSGNHSPASENNTQLYERHLRVEVDTLIEASRQGSLDLVRKLLCRIVPQFTPADGEFTVDASASEKATAKDAVLLRALTPLGGGLPPQSELSPAKISDRAAPQAGKD